jgi:hypothetical protein
MFLNETVLLVSRDLTSSTDPVAIVWPDLLQDNVAAGEAFTTQVIISFSSPSVAYCSSGASTHVIGTATIQEHKTNKTRVIPNKENKKTRQRGIS